MVRRSRAEWAAIVAKFESSGESVTKFCAKRRISKRTFAWWRWQLGDEPVAPAQESVRLIAVDVKDAVPRPATSAGALEIGLGDLAIRVDAGTDVTYVAALVNALRSRC